MSASSPPSPPSVEQAIRLILQKNFDADSKVCFLTLLKIIDNILQKPGNDKVRSLRTGNPTIQSKIIDKHGHHVLMACGFSHEPADPKWQKDERLVLEESKEDTDVLVKARHTLARIAVLELGLTAADLPKYKAPPAKVSLPSTSASAGTSSSSSSSGGFDVYAGNRFDGQSAALGTNLGPPKNWKSKTEQELETLKQREAQLQRNLQTKHKRITTTTNAKQPSSGGVDRQWTVALPGQTPAVAAAEAANAHTTGPSSRGDSSLLAARFQQQQAQRKALDQKGFTTKAMRDLAKLKKTKVYSHTQLAIHFPDGISVKANFATTELLAAVRDGLSRDVLFSTQTLPLPAFELYQTPPRRVLEGSKSLRDLGLVPAAKVYLSWKTPLPQLGGGGLEAGWYIRPECLGAGTAGAAPSLPTSVSVLPDKKPAASSNANSNSTTATTAKRKKTRAEKEAALMKRMLGKR